MLGFFCRGFGVGFLRVRFRGFCLLLRVLMIVVTQTSLNKYEIIQIAPVCITLMIKTIINILVTKTMLFDEITYNPFVILVCLNLNEYHLPY